jgi:hypothetical protein
MSETFRPVQRLDAPRLVESINATYDLGLRYDGPASGGNVGAGYVIDPGGRRSVLTWQPGSSAEHHRGIADLLDIVRARGVPAPRYEHVLQVGDAVAVIQELLPGAPPTEIGPALIDQLVELNHRLRRALPDSPHPPSQLYLAESGPGFCLHEPLAAFSDRTRRLLDWVHEVAATSGSTMDGPDLVHLDYQPANILTRNDKITGIIDWDGAGRGDGRFDLVVLYFGLHPHNTDRRLYRILTDELSGDDLRKYWASMSLRMVDWAIRHYTPSDVDTWLDIAEVGITRL